LADDQDDRRVHHWTVTPDQQYQAPGLVVGSVIAFDELYNYPNYADHELKALLELAATTGIKYRHLGHTTETTAASLQITHGRGTRQLRCLPTDGA
jgi:hypothetical protein